MFGVALVLPGASQPAVAADLDLDLVESGLLASALSLGLGIGVVAAGPAVDRLPRRPLFCGAALFGAVGVALLPWQGSYAAAFAAVLVLGLGGGVFETVINTVIPEQNPERAASRLALAHALATAGAAIGAGVLGAGIAALGWRGAWLGLGIGYAVLAAVGSGVRLPGPPPTALPREERRGLWPAVLPFVIAAAAYVGLETAFTVFLPPLVQDAGLDPQRGPLAISAFWGGLLISRLGFAAVTRRTNVRVLAACGVAGALLLALGPWARSLPEIWAGGVGLALGPVFPLLVAAASQHFVHMRGTATGIVVGAGSFGGAVLPWAAGALGEATSVVWAVTSLAAASLAVAFGARR